VLGGSDEVIERRTWKSLVKMSNSKTEM